MIVITFVFLFYLFYSLSRITCGVTTSTKCLVGKTAIVIGGSLGIGYQVSLNLASRGCKVIIAARNVSKTLRQEIIKATGNSNIVMKKLNLASFRSIRDFVDDIKENEEKLDILVNNAATSVASGLTEDGLNELMQINYFGPFLLTCLLTDLLKKSSPSRIIFTSSILAFIGDFNLNVDVEDSVKAYSNSKLATIVASDMFAKKLKNTGVTCNSLHPGIVRTSIFKKYQQSSFIAFCITTGILLFALFFGKTTWEGAQTTVHLAISEKLENVTGKYFWDCHQFPKPWKAYDENAARHLWTVTENYVKLLPSEKI